ncbi:butyrophilin-like protein 2 [Octodon degus]|uniref:Butyrophilin-like protein 2 n=1 Tax=Octodon degus TaxID=10160 RepID=A0A6P6DWT3_OCTDE|nr:butyrophilin-like protein 2 [Octodon degus]
MAISWYRDGRSVLVHEYRDSQDRTEQQSLEYQGRTQLLRESITQGKVALRIHPVIPGDEGDYSCVFVTPTELGHAQFELRVSASGTPPLIYVEPAHTGSITLTCSSSGWYPDPELQWRDPHRRHLSPDSRKVSLGVDGLVHVESSVTVEESSRAEVSCSIRNPVLGEEKEVWLAVAESLFPRVSAWTVALAVLLVLLAVALVTTAVLLLRSRRAREESMRSLREARWFAASGAPPLIHVQPAHTGSITLTCSSSGWYPDPELQWREPRGRLLLPESKRQSIGEDGLIRVESTVTVDESSKAGVFCLVRNPVLREEKEARLSMAEALFPRVSAWTVALAVLLVLLAVALVTTAVLLLRSRRARGLLPAAGILGWKKAQVQSKTLSGPAHLRSI